MTAEQLAAELRKHDAAMTEAPWLQGEVSGQCHMRHAHGRGDCQYEYRISADAPENRRCIALPPDRTLISTDDNGPILSEANAAGIAFLGTHRGELLALADGLRAENAKLRAACDRVCRETDWCPVCEQNPSTGHRENCLLHEAKL